MTRLAIVVLAMAMVLAACGGTEPELTGFIRTPLPNVSDVTLPDAANGGEAFAMQADEDHVLLVYFGYTSCPDVCPTTLADVRATVEDLGAAGDRIELAMATVDPARDTDDVITGYVQSFLDGAHGLRTTDDAALQAAAMAFGAGYDVAANDAGEIEVIHTGHLYAVDDQGVLQVTWPFGTARSDLLSDLQILLDA